MSNTCTVRRKQKANKNDGDVIVKEIISPAVDHIEKHIVYSHHNMTDVTVKMKDRRLDKQHSGK